MPTGYTQLLVDNPDMPLNKWALHCARAFGACITMRDDDPNLPAPKKFKPDLRYHKNSLRKAHALIRKLEKMNQKQRDAYTKKKREETKKHYTEQLKTAEEDQKAFDNMKFQIKNWNPPSQYDGLKKFMLEQIESSTTHASYYIDNLNKVDTTDYWKEDLNAAKHGIQYHTEGIAKEIEATNKRNEWLLGLYKNLPKK